MIKVRNEGLKKIFESHGLQATETNGWLAINGSLPAIRCRYEIKEHSFPLVFEVLLPDNRIIEECIVGIGESEEEAYLNGIQAFMEADLHVLLSALWNIDTGEQITIENWNINGKHWTTYIGNFTRRSTMGTDFPYPKELFETIETEIRKAPLTSSINWARIYYGSVKSDFKIAEFMVNNQNVTSSEDIIGNLNWKKSEKFYSIRSFLILKRNGEAKRSTFSRMMKIFSMK